MRTQRQPTYSIMNILCLCNTSNCTQNILFVASYFYQSPMNVFFFVNIYKQTADASHYFFSSAFEKILAFLSGNVL